jgi:hypothetical protein
MNYEKAIILARKNIGGVMESSARLCLEDAIRLRDEGKYDYAKQWAIRSLSYSVGIFHPDYKKATI